MRIRLLGSLLLLLGIVAGPFVASAYTTNGVKWSVSRVPYYVNPANLDVSTSAATAAVQAGASVWGSQSGASVALQYAGATTGTTVQNNGKNEVFFRNASSGSTVAEVTWWADANNRLVDADLVFWDGAYTFFTGSSGCSGGLYIEDIAAHEFGHVLGLNHSAVATATMYPTASWCSTAWRSLDADDIAGIQSLYPGSGCTVSVSPTSVNVGSTGGTSSLTVSTQSGCAWSATSGASWITVATGASGSGSGTVTVSVAPNTAASTRTGTLTVGGVVVTIAQAAAASVACAFTVSPTSISVTAAGGTGSIAVSTSSGCGWSASSSVAWASVTPASGTGPATVSYSVASNTTTSQRAGLVTIAGQAVTVTQAALLPPRPATNLRIKTP